MSSVIHERLRPRLVERDCSHRATWSIVSRNDRAIASKKSNRFLALTWRRVVTPAS